MKLLMLKGLPASGKSTYAKELAKSGWVRVNKDDLRTMLHNSDPGILIKSNEKQVLRIRDDIIIDSLKNNRSVVVDDTNLAPKHEDRLKELAKEYGATFETKTFDVPIDELIERDRKRERPVGEKVIRSMHKTFVKPKAEPLIQDKSLPKAIMVDVDGTLALIHNRSPFDWSNVESDLPNEPVVKTVELFRNAGYKILILSGRMADAKDGTIKWLKNHGIKYDHFWMRESGDTRKDAIIKTEIFEEHIKNKYYIELVLDDRNQVVDMWRETGLTVFQVNYGDF